jgi:hypothetical protein
MENLHYCWMFLNQISHIARISKGLKDLHSVEVENEKRGSMSAILTNLGKVQDYQCSCRGTKNKELISTIPNTIPTT